MTRLLPGWRWFSVTVVVAAVLGGCKDKQQAAPGTAGDPTVVATKPAGTLNDLDLLPLDSEVVIGVHLSQLQNSPIWKELALPELMKERDVVGAIEAFKARCSIDVTTDIARISIGVKGINDELPDGAAVLHGLDQTKTLACVDKWKADAIKEKVTLHNEGGVITALDDDGYGIGLVFVADATALVLIGHGMSTARVKAAAAGTSMLSKSQAFLAMYNKIDSQATVWAFVRGSVIPSEVADVAGVRPKAIFGSVKLDGGVAARVYARLDSSEQATETAGGLRGQVEALASMVDKAELSSDGPDLQLAVTASAAKLASLLELMR